jgi:hypothetical protein
VLIVAQQCAIEVENVHFPTRPNSADSFSYSYPPESMLPVIRASARPARRAASR